MPETLQMGNRVQIHILPSADEDDDMETLSLVEDVRLDFLDEISQFGTFTVEIAGAEKRDAGLIFLIPEIAHGIIAQKDLIMQFFQVSQIAIDALSKQGHVKAIEMTVDGDHIRIEDASDAQADRLISIFEAKHPGKVQQITSSSVVEITGIVSKAEQLALPERTSTEKE